MNDDNPLARVNLQVWQPPPPRAVDPVLLLGRMVAPVAPRRRTRWIIATLATANIALVVALLLAMFGRTDERGAVRDGLLDRRERHRLALAGVPGVRGRELRRDRLVERAVLGEGLLVGVGEEQAPGPGADVRGGGVVAVLGELLPVPVDQHLVGLAGLQRVRREQRVAPLRGEVDGVGHGTYHFSSGKDVAITELYDAVVGAMQLNTYPEPEIRELGPDDAPSILLDPSRTFADFGDIEFTPLSQTVKEAVAYYREHGVHGEYTHLAHKKN